jgi:hypothetical protein
LKEDALSFQFGAASLDDNGPQTAASAFGFFGGSGGGGGGSSEDSSHSQNVSYTFDTPKASWQSMMAKPSSTTFQMPDFGAVADAANDQGLATGSDWGSSNAAPAKAEPVASAPVAASPAVKPSAPSTATPGERKVLKARRRAGGAAPQANEEEVVPAKPSSASAARKVDFE